MFAAAPLPPPGSSRGLPMNGYSNGTPPAAPGPHRDASSASSMGTYPAIAEIVASAEERVKEYSQQPIARLVRHAADHLHGAKSKIENRTNIAAAYWEYLVAYDVLVEEVPKHRDYYDKIQLSRNQLHRDYYSLTKEIGAYEERFKKIKDIIINDNKRNGAHNRSASATVPYSASSAPPSRTPIHRRDDELMLPSTPSVLSAGVSGTARPKPQIQPKPEYLHGHTIHRTSASMGSDVDKLAERFARLSGTVPTVHTSPSFASPEGRSVTMPSPSEYQSSTRPLGPRDMPPASMQTLGHSGKLSLNTNVTTSMPREPSPTYSPARNLSLPESINPPRSSARSIVGTGGRMQASSASAHPPNVDGNAGSYFPPANGNHIPPTIRRHSSINKPVEEQISAATLYDYLRVFKVLVIDVRDRTSFDQGHILGPSTSISIMCIEPTSLHDGCSADQLHDRLILSPDEEQAMFDRRHEYELVVYYDERTVTCDFLYKHHRTEKEQALKRLYDTLHEFNDEKPLQRPPIFLMGGLRAWVDMLGDQGLQASSTSTVVATKQTKPQRALRRATAATHGGNLDLHPRRLREYVPMDLDEEEQWRAEAREGRADPGSTENDADEDVASPMFHSTEDFLRRFPAVEVEQQSMVHPPRRPPPLPQYAPPPVPVAPSRPAPSVPRMSYSGVHERQVATQGRAAQLPIYISPPRYGQFRHHRTGLINFGVTCYMNSVVQCLSANPDLAAYLLSREYTKCIQKENFKGSKGLISESLDTLISNLFNGSVTNCRPSTFRKMCGRYNSNWAIDEQQDALEFLEFVFEMLHEDLNVFWNKTPLKQLTKSEELTREALPRPYVAKVEWNRYLHRECSRIGNWFAGQHASRLTCMTCGTTSTTYEAFWNISVEIPRDRPADLRDCLRSYCATEHLSGGEGWKCPRCECNREATKKITITRAPDYLTVHFKRFSASRHERATKIHTPIDFPLSGLDLQPFMEPPITPEQEAYVMSAARDGEAQLVALRSDPAMNGPYIYHAYAVIWHIGNTISSGHYIAHVKDRARGCWRRFNDDRVADFDPGALSPQHRLQNEKAYIVFYERERVAGGAV